MFYVLLVIVILLIALYFVNARAEPYRSCRDCDGYVVAPNGMPVLNPFLWPYSGSRCVDDVYILSKDAGVDIGTAVTPLTHLNSPDHVLLTN